MNRALLASTTTAAILMTASSAQAQQGSSTVVQTAPGESTVVITTAPGSSPVVAGSAQSGQGYQSYALEEADAGVRRTRNALIAMSATAAVGMIVGATAFRHCTQIGGFDYYDSNLVCTQRGDALLAAGGAIFGLAAIGMITSGIMLGVRKGKRRRLRRDIQSQTYGARLQWNSESGALEF